MILTAKHVAENAQREQHRLGIFKCSSPIPDFVAGILLFPGDVDVALLVVKDDFSSALKSVAVPKDSVPVGAADIMDGDSLVLNGFPTQIIKQDENERTQAFTLITYWCCPTNISYDEYGRYHLEWKDAIEWQGDQACDLPSPQGMSGGPLWCFRKPASSSLWSASRIGKIVGIQSSWDRKETAIIEPINRWCRWFHDSLHKIDHEF